MCGPCLVGFTQQQGDVIYWKYNNGDSRKASRVIMKLLFKPWYSKNRLPLQRKKCRTQVVKRVELGSVTWISEFEFSVNYFPRVLYTV